MINVSSRSASGFLSSSGEMGARIRSFNWFPTLLGCIEQWPQLLKNSLSLILDSCHPMWIGWGPQMTFLYNDAYVRLLGPARHPWALGRPAPEVWAEIWDLCGPLAARVFENGEATFADDVRLFLDRGGCREEAYYSFSFSPMRDDSGRVCGLFCPSTRVRPIDRGSKIFFPGEPRTEAAQDEAALLLGAIVDSSDDAIISKDLNGTITSWNRSAERLFGFTAAEAIGQPVATLLIPPDRQEEEPRILERLRAGERVDHFETVRRHKDGRLLDISLTISPVKDPQGRIIGASKIARDISCRKRAEAALRESEAKFRQLADAMPQIVWTAGAGGHVDYYNQRWYQFSGMPQDQFGEESWRPVLHPEDIARASEAWRDSVRTGRPFQIEIRLCERKRNRWRWFVSRALPATDEHGRIVKWFGTSTDIDDQKHVETELRRANKDLEQFAYSATHDLQEPLRSMKIYAELLASRYGAKLDVQALEFLQFLRAGASRMEVLVRDLLEYTQVTRVEIPAEPSDANEALKASLANLGGAIAENNAVITCDPLPPLRVHMTHLRQLFQNLLGNAIKYRHPDRAPVVHVSAEQRGSAWVVSVRDNGIGIKPEYKEHIFGLFKRLHTGDEYSGTGIGLAICQRTVERYDGRIWVESKPGEGSTFRFTIPI
ncbi:MAG TPA: PAS domain S-box protein [Bryobacteraceae bacterium]|nr:PAS domain S-box protein [Bryobacteraceae bacterium]